MKIFLRILFILIVLIILPSYKQEKIISGEYNGGRFGFSGVYIQFYENSTYKYFEWLHTGRYLNDSGVWICKNNRHYLKSANKTRWNYKKTRPSKKFYRFKKQEFKIMGDTLFIIPKDIKDSSYYSDYYTLYKNKN